MSENKKQIKYMFNINCNCKKTLKKISRDPDKIVETDKELIYVFILKRKQVEDFVSELGNLRLPYVQRVI
jgi:DNA-binding protein YbaB